MFHTGCKYYEGSLIIKGWNPFMGMTDLSVCSSIDRCLSASYISLTVQYFRNLFSAFIRKGPKSVKACFFYRNRTVPTGQRSKVM
jgi:hypothetical protein